MPAKSPSLAAIASLLTLVVGCSGTGSLFTSVASPRDRYRAMLEESGLDQTALGRDWLRVGEEALRQSLSIDTPFGESAYFPPEQTTAVAYRLELRRGRRLEITVVHETASPGAVFVELFQTVENGTPRLVASLPLQASTFTYAVERDGTYIVRVQPELLRGGRVTITERTLAALATFPVQGLTARAVQSEFGAARDAGRREHQGIDIFARRGTAVMSVADGFARADTNNLGGRVVWLRDLQRGVTYYYAHLDRWAISGLARVRAGDVIGYVGNTGNARTTAPHLHFGIYAGGAIDPLPFVARDDDAPAPPTARVDDLGQFVRVRASRTPLRDGPLDRTREIATLQQGTVARALGAAHGSLRVLLPDRTIGYVPARALVGASTPLQRARVASGALLREAPSLSGPIITPLAEGGSVDILGRFGDFDLVRTPDGGHGWIARRSPSAAAAFDDQSSTKLAAR